MYNFRYVDKYINLIHEKIYTYKEKIVTLILIKFIQYIQGIYTFSSHSNLNV